MREREKAEKAEGRLGTNVCIQLSELSELSELVTFNYKCKYINRARLARSLLQHLTNERREHGDLR